MKDSTWIIGKVQEVYKDAHPDKDWPSFYHGWIEGRAKALETRPLQWTKHGRNLTLAKTPIGNYEILWEKDAHWLYVPFNSPPEWKPSYEEALQSAERHYTRLVLSMLKG